MEFGDCGDDCIDLGSRNFAHAGDVQFYYDKDVDDEVVQWATCLESVLSCIKDGSTDDPTLISACVTVSSCPKSCQIDYAEQASTSRDIKKQLVYFQNVFLKEGASCRPPE